MLKSSRFQQLRASVILGAVAGGAVFATFCVAGCGGPSETSPSKVVSASEGGKLGIEPTALPPASISGPTTASTQTADNQPAGAGRNSAQNSTQADSSLPEKGSPEWLLGQMIVVHNEPFPASQPPQQRNALLRERNKKLVEMAHEVIRKTHKDASKEPVFNKAVQFLINARIDLALGSAEDAKALSEDAEALYNRAPKSIAAADAAHGVVRLTSTKARLSREPRFVQEFAVQARLFASRFPKDARAGQLLLVAGQSCEHFHIDAEAVSCLALLQENFSQIPQSQQATAILRRLELKGRPAKIGGPTRKGGFITLDQLRGKPILVVFWSSDSDSFEEILPKLKATLQPYENGDLAVLGVCLDEAEETLDQFVQKNGLSWTQIFYADPAKRHWEHPLVQYYGVRDIPSLWLVNADGIVVDTRVTPETLEGQLRYLVAAGGHTARQ